jgi:hypothetical protein
MPGMGGGGGGGFAAVGEIFDGDGEEAGEMEGHLRTLMGAARGLVADALLAASDALGAGRFWIWFRMMFCRFCATKITRTGGLGNLPQKY